MGHGEGYQYSHNLPGPDTQAFVPQRKDYYRPKNSGFETQLAEKLKVLRAARQKAAVLPPRPPA